MQSLFQKLLTLPGTDTPLKYNGETSNGIWNDGTLTADNAASEYSVIGGIPLFMGKGEKQKFPKSFHFLNDTKMSSEELIRSNWETMRTDREIDSLYNDWTQTILDTNGLILELSAGPGGGLAPLLLDYDVDVKLLIHGLDYYTLKEIKEITDNTGAWENIGFAQFDFCKFPVKSDSFEAVNSFGAVSNMPDTANAFAEIFRILRPGGRLFLLDMELTPDSFEDLPENARNEMAEFDPNYNINIKSRLAEAGFGIEYYSLTEERLIQPRENVLADIANHHGIQLSMQTFRLEARKPININFNSHPFSADSIP